MQLLAIAAGIIAYLVVSNVVTQSISRKDLHEEARLERLRKLAQRGDLTFDNE